MEIAAAAAARINNHIMLQKQRNERPENEDRTGSLVLFNDII